MAVREEVMITKTTVSLDEGLLARVRPFVPQRGLSRFINEILAEKLAALEREQIEAEMKEGYLATRADRDALAEEWRVVDTEGWPE
jgi:metal-responsive CopG/Arc/MetJ family transcriptional regulator